MTAPHTQCQPDNASAMKLLSMDYALLKHLVEFDGSVPTISIPSKIFAGEIPEGALNLVDAGLIEHRGDVTAITSAGRKILNSTNRSEAA